MVKSRGMAHSNQIREFRLTNHGIELLDVYVGSEGVLTGSARLSQETKDDVEQLLRQQEIGTKQFGLERKRDAMEAQIIVLRSEFQAEEAEALKIITIEKARNERFVQDKVKMGKSRRGDVSIKITGTKRIKKYLKELTVKIKDEKPKTGRRTEQPAKARSDKWVLRLYVAGQTPKAITAFNNLKLICEEQLKGKYHIEVIDLLKNPQLARDDQILAVPTLVRKLPCREEYHWRSF